MKKHQLVLASVVLSSLMLTACGGSSAPTVNPTVSNTPPSNVIQSNVVQAAAQSPVDYSVYASRAATTDMTAQISQLAYTELNNRRTACGFSALSASTALEQAAAQHANYLFVSPNAGHQEVAGNSFFSGETPKARAQATGYIAAGDINTVLGEINEELVILTNSQESIEKTALKSVYNLMSAPYHMVGMLDDATDMGVALKSQKNGTDVKTIFNMKVGRNTAKTIANHNSNTVLHYPCNASTNVPTQVSREYPDPLANLITTENIANKQLSSSNAIGHPVFVRSPNGTSIQIHKVSIKDNSASVIATYEPLTAKSDATGQIYNNEAIIMPKAALQQNSTYNVQIILSYVHDLTGIKQDKLLNYTFTTGDNNATLF